MESFGLGLKFRKDIGLSRKYIAEMAGVSEATVMHYEKGDNVANESGTKIRRAYRTARNLYSRRNREAYMEHIRNYLNSNKIGIVEFSKMVQTGSDIYRDPKMKSRILATADQIIKIEKATGIAYNSIPAIRSASGYKEDLIEVAKPGPKVVEHLENDPCKNVDCTIIGYSIQYNDDGTVQYRKKMRRVITEIFEVDVTADEVQHVLNN